jgi:hypothetical protein
MTEDVSAKRALARDRDCLETEVDEKNQSIYLSFSSRRALHKFAQALMNESIFGQSGRLEFESPTVTAQGMTSKEVQLTEASLSIYVFYPDQ